MNRRRFILSAIAAAYAPWAFCSIGKFRTLDEFGWTSGLTPTNQRIAVQAAFDSAEPLLMPRGETVQIDAGLVANHPLHLLGHGADTQVAGSAASMFRCAVPGVSMITLNPGAHNSRLCGFAIQADATGGAGIVLGDGTTDHVRGVVIEKVSTNPNLLFGIHVLAAGGFVIDKSWLWGADSALRLENRIAADTGDNKITDCDLNAVTGAGLKWTSGGGLYMKGCKFNNGANHIYMDWSLAGSGGFVAVGNSFESCSGISVDLRGAFNFERMMLVGNTWAVPSVAIAARNFCSTNWLKQLEISSNTIKVLGASPALDLGCTDNAFVASNSIDGTGVATAGIITRNGTGAIGINRIVGCASQHLNYASWSMTSAGQL